MDKGLLTMLAVGAAIVYFATHFSGDNELDDDISWSVQEKKKGYEKYYEEDALGDMVLNLSSLSLDQAKQIWPTTPTAKKIAGILPDFNLAKTEVKNSITKGAFRDYLLEYLDGLEGRFLSGELNSERTRKALMSFQ